MVLVAWVAISPPAALFHLSGGLVWVALCCLAVLGLTIGGYTGRFGVVLVLGIAVAGMAVAAALADLLIPVVARPFLHLSTGPGAQRITGVAATLVVVCVVLGRRHRHLRVADLLLVGIVALFLVDDLGILNSTPMRDLSVYLVAGDRFFHGQQPYLTSVIANQADGFRLGLPFLYPPFMLPVFAVLAQLPKGLVVAAWFSVSLASAIAALRWLGVRPRWIAILLLWPPLLQGMAVGNVAIFIFGLFAAAPRAPWTLPLMTVFKLQSAVPSIWLIRERHWNSLAIGLALVAVAALVTLPIVGITIWLDWFHGLQLMQASQALYTGLYGIAIPHYVPYAVFLLIAGAGVVIATILGRGRDGLARLGIASVIASPSLYRHGFLVMLPALLGNGELVFWLSLGLGGGGTGLILTIVTATIGSFRFTTTAARSADTIHPLGPRGAPWGTQAPSPGRQPGSPT